MRYKNHRQAEHRHLQRQQQQNPSFPSYESLIDCPMAINNAYITARISWLISRNALQGVQ